MQIRVEVVDAGDVWRAVADHQVGFGMSKMREDKRDGAWRSEIGLEGGGMAQGSHGLEVEGDELSCARCELRSALSVVAQICGLGISDGCVYTSDLLHACLQGSKPNGHPRTSSKFSERPP